LYETINSRFFDEMIAADGTVREPYRMIGEWINSQPRGGIAEKARAAEAIFRRLGITFAVYG
jgi:uncharacterized circularly permuted ATP-grasp superfamily protein